jgi:hypothetical protein
MLLLLAALALAGDADFCSLPCRIAVIEDDEKNVGVLTPDWGSARLDSANGSMGVSPELAAMAKNTRDKPDNILQAGANGGL